MNKFTITLNSLVILAASLCILASCEGTPETPPLPKSSVVKPFRVISPAEDLEPNNGINKVYYSLVRDFTGDTLAIYQSSSGGVQIVNVSQQRIVNAGISSK